MSLPSIFFKEIEGKGRGVFSEVDIAGDKLIERCPVILITSAAEINLLACTSLLNYAFRWNTNEEILAIALGFGSLYNHSSINNACYRMNVAENIIDIMSLRTIKQGEEITINYVGSGSKNEKQWFQDRGIMYVQ